MNTGNVQDRKHHTHHNTCRGAVHIKHVHVYTVYMYIHTCTIGTECYDEIAFTALF